MHALKCLILEVSAQEKTDSFDDGKSFTSSCAEVSSEAFLCVFLHCFTAWEFPASEPKRTNPECRLLPPTPYIKPPASRRIVHMRLRCCVLCLLAACATAGAECPNLIAYYMFDDAGNPGLNSAPIATSIGNALTPLSAPTQPTISTSDSKFGGSAYFEGANGKAIILDYNTNNLYNALYEKNITVTFWCKAVTVGQNRYGRIFYGAKDGAANNKNSFQMTHWQTNQLRLHISVDTASFQSTTAMPAFDTAWTHVAVVLEKQIENWQNLGHAGRIYLNGMLDVSNSEMNMPEITQNYNFYIGRWINDGSREYDGYIDEFRIYDGVLSADVINVLATQTSAEEVQVCATAGAECPSYAFALGGGQCEACAAGQTRDTSLVSWLRFEDEAVLNYDTITRDETGVVTGAADTVHVVSGGIIGKSMQQETGAGIENLRLEYTCTQCGDSWTLTFFHAMMVGVKTSYPSILRIYDQSEERIFSMWYKKEDAIANELRFKDDADTTYISEPIEHGENRLIVLLYDHTSPQLEVRIGSQSWSVDASNTDFHLFEFESSAAYSSRFDDLRLYNRVLSATEVAALANQATTGNEVLACAECAPGDSSAGCGCAADSFLGPASSSSALCLAQFDKTGTSAYSEGCKFRLGGARSVTWTATLDLAPGFLDITFRSDEAGDRDTNDPIFIQINGAEVYRKLNDGCEPTLCEDTIPWPGPATITITATSSISTTNIHSSIESLMHRASQCLACPAGKTAPSGSTSDTDCTCAPGSYLDTSGGEESCATCPGNTYKSIPGDDVGLCLTCPAGSTIADTPSAPAPHASAAECECAAGSYGVPGDVHEYRIVRADGRAGPVVFDTVRFLDASGGEVQIYAEDPAPHGG